MPVPAHTTISTMNQSAATSGAAQQPQRGDKNSSLKVGRVKQKQVGGEKKSADASLRSAGNGPDLMPAVDFFVYRCSD